MNVGIVTTWFERGAAYVSKQYMKLLEKEYEVFIYARAGEKYAVGDPHWDLDNVTWGKSKNEYPTDIVLSDFKDWLINNQIEVVLFNEQLYYEPIIIAKEMGIKVGGYVDYYTLATVSFFRIYDFLICNTKRHFSVFKDHEQAYYVPWGTDTDVFKANSYGLAEDGVVTFFASVGYAPKRKGVDKILQAFALLNKEYKCKLIIHTQVDILKDFPELEDTVESLIHDGKLKVIEEEITAPGLYYMGDVYVYPSWLDGIGLTLLEALASGLPIITTDCAPMNEFGSDEIRRLVAVDRYVSRGDAYYWPLSIVNIESLKRAMEYYIDHAEELPKLKRKAREWAENYGDWFQNEKQVLQIFDNSERLPIDSLLVARLRNHDRKSRRFEVRLKDFLNKMAKVNRMLNNVAKDGRIAVYGAGTHTQKLFQLADFSDIEVCAILDKNHAGEVFEGYNVYHPEQIRELCLDSVVVSSFKWQDEIEEELKNIYHFQGEIVKLYDSEDTNAFFNV